MIAQGRGGKIVNTGSIAGRQGFWDFTPYCVAKFGVVAVTQATARGLIQHGITVNAFAPGVVDTPMWIGLNEDLRTIHDQAADADPMTDFARRHAHGPPAEADGAHAVPRLPGVARVRLHDRADVHGRRRPGPGLARSAKTGASRDGRICRDRPDGVRDGSQHPPRRLSARRLEPNRRALRAACGGGSRARSGARVARPRGRHRDDVDRRVCCAVRPRRERPPPTASARLRRSRDEHDRARCRRAARSRCPSA